MTDNNAGRLKKKGDKLFDKHDYQEAMRYYTRAIKINPDIINAQTMIDRGNVLFEKEEFAKAINYYEKAAEINPNAEWAWRNKGLALSVLGKHKAAIKCYDKAIDIEPMLVEAWNDRGVSVLQLGRYDEAIRCYDEAIKIDPYYVDAWVNKGDTLLDRQKYDSAIECYDMAIDIEPGNLEALSGKTRVLELLGKHDEVAKISRETLEYITEELEFEPDDPFLLIAQGDNLMNIGEYSEAERCYNRVLQSDPGNMDALDRLGSLYADHMYRNDKSLVISRKMLEIEPDNLVLQANLIEDLVAVGQYEEARGYISEVLGKTCSSEYQCVIRFFLLASYLLEGETTKADEEFARFFEYYEKQKSSFKIDEDQWVFRGFINAISISNATLTTKFLLLALIELINGRIDRQRFSFFYNHSGAPNRN